MTEAAPLPDELQKDKGLFGKQRWRGKLFASEDFLPRKDQQSKGSNDEEVAQFLRAAAPKPTVTTQYSALTPCIDTASAPRWPSATKVEVPMAAEDGYHRPKPRQNKGLRVKFMSTPVVIIGEGGDEAKLPSRDVSRSNTISPEDSSVRPMSLPRRPTGLEDPATENKGLQDDREVSHVGQKISTTFLGHKKLPKPPQVSVQDDMPQVQEYDVGSPYDQTSRKSLDSAYSDDHEPRKDRLDTSARNETPSMFPEHIKSSDHSSIPRVSPEPPLGPRATSPRPVSLQNPDAQQTSNADSSLPSVQPESVSISQNEEAHWAGPLSLRNVAKNLGIDAFDDFHTRARRFHEIFRLGIAVHQDLMSVPFTRWVQIAIWWFLKGRGELESAVRARPHSACREDSGQPQSIPSDLKQAYVNLAKAWWIVKEVTPDHPDLKRFGSASMISMAAIIRRFGDPTLASFVDAHVSLIANMRALAMSMKRNGRLPPDIFEIQKLHTRVLHSPLDLPSSVASLVSGRSQQDLDTPSHSLIPIGDSEHHFSFGRAFVDVFLTSRHKQWDMIRVPSVVSILRKKTDLDTTALITGQSGEIDLTISPKSTQASGLTWKAVHWRPSSLALYMNLSEDVEFSIKFSEEGFKTLWDIYDYNREIQRDSEGREGEQPVFECITRYLQLSRKLPHPKSFPQGPVENCKIRIFAKTLTVSNGSSERRVDVGYRVMVNTSLKLKIVSTYSQDCGAEKPMIFSRHSRDEGPRLGLTLPTPWLSRLDIVFCNMYELDRFRSTLCDTITFENDYCSPYLPLQRLEICTSTGTEFEPDDSKLSGYACNLDLHWQGVRIIERRPSVHGSNQSSTVRSRNRRLILQGQLGHITDYINFSKLIRALPCDFSDAF